MTQNNQQDSEKSAVSSLISWGADIAGGISGGLIGFALGGPLGAAAGGPAGQVIGHVTKSVVTDIANRTMSHYERKRVGIAAVRTLKAIDERLEAGELLRNDASFNEANSDERSAAEELFEGVLLKCKSEYEEKKTFYIQNIFVNIAFNSEISPDAAYSLLSIVDRLTYRQICLLALLGRFEEYKIEPSIIRNNLRVMSNNNTPAMFLIQEFNDLESYGFFDELMGDDTAYLSRMGQIAFKLLGLESVPTEDLHDLRLNLP